MVNNESHISLKALGAEMRELRHARGMSVIRFAGELGKPAWLIDVIEHADEATASSLCSLLPKREIESVRNAFMRLRRTACFLAADARGGQSVSLTERTFYLPVTVSVDGLTDAMEQMLLFAADGAECDAKRQQVLRQGVMSVSMLACLLQTQYRRAGNEKKARQCLRCFRENLQAHMRICC